ncbi:cupin domain-containing protein [Candidatus Bathyarchaeota archaeon]|nr:MAG: cupin domain-containing protein [Candidatus Bathyarchaeota archaeon]
MYVVSSDSVRAYRLGRGRGVTVRYLLHAGVGARRLQLRLFTIEPGGYTPLERHEHEHEVYILRGRLLVKGGEEEVVVGPGDAIFIASMEPHQFLNIGGDPAEFLCTKETGEIPEILKREEGVRGE